MTTHDRAIGTQGPLFSTAPSREQLSHWRTGSSGKSCDTKLLPRRRQTRTQSSAAPVPRKRTIFLSALDTKLVHATGTRAHRYETFGERTNFLSRLPIGALTNMPRSSHREKLLKVGLNVVHAQGFAGASVRDIVHAAGVPQGSFTNHSSRKKPSRSKRSTCTSRARARTSHAPCATTRCRRCSACAPASTRPRSS
jgi:hypothetical protein